MMAEVDVAVLRGCFLSLTYPSADEIRARLGEILDRNKQLVMSDPSHPLMMPNPLAVGFVGFFTLVLLVFFSQVSHGTADPACRS